MRCEPFICSPAPGGACSPISSSATTPSAPSSGTPMPAACCASGPRMDGCQDCTSTKATCASSISDPGPAGWINSQRDSLVRIFQRPDEAQGSPEAEAGSSQKSSAPLMKSGRRSSSSKTPRTSAPRVGAKSSANSWRVDIPGETEKLPHLMSAQAMSATVGSCLLPTLTVSGNWNRKGASKESGNGLATALRLLPTLCAANARQASDNRAGPGRKNGMTLPSAMARLPTLCARDWKNSGGSALTDRGKSRLPSAMAHMLPTVCASDYKSPYSEAGYHQQTQHRSKPLRDTLPHSTGHRLTPGFAEWWMGWPLGWTALNAPATGKSRSKRQRPG